MENIGYEIGEICNRGGCQGVLEEYEQENCTCHLNPPCSYCVEDKTYCPECEWEGKSEQ